MTRSTVLGAVPRVLRVLPDAGEADLRPLLDALSTAPTGRPFGPESIAFCADLSRALARRARRLPEMQALAYWIRRSEIARLRDSFAALEDDRTVLVPRGTVFHVPPANVDSIFVYSWLLAVLTGNRNVVRLSDRTGDQAEILLEVVRDTLHDHPAIRASTLMLRCGHDRDVVDALSGACDLRVVWGGDRSVEAVRRSPLPAHGLDLTFPDRTSLAMIKTASFEAMSDARRDRLVEDFHNDTYWFDQLGCSSPRALVWVGDRGRVDALSGDFFRRLQVRTGRAGYSPDPAAALDKLAFGYRSVIDQAARSFRTYDATVSVLDVPSFPQLGGEFSGGGMFFMHRVDRLHDLVAGVDRRVQTLVQHGFDDAELRELAVRLNGRGVDRIVPFGQALTFDRIWDGNDLLQSLTRRVTIGTRTWSR